MRVVLLIRCIGIYAAQTHHGEKCSGFTELSIHAYLSSRIVLSIEARKRKKSPVVLVSHTHTYTQTHIYQSRSTCCLIASLVLTERVERRTGIRELSSLLDLASECDTRCSRPSASRFAPRVCVHGYIRTHTCPRSLLDQASVRSRIICARN